MYFAGMIWISHLENIGMYQSGLNMMYLTYIIHTYDV